MKKLFILSVLLITGIAQANTLREYISTHKSEIIDTMAKMQSVTPGSGDYDNFDFTVINCLEENSRASSNQFKIGVCLLHSHYHPGTDTIWSFSLNDEDFDVTILTMDEV